MKILIDISHPAQVNFFKHIVTKLAEGGNEVHITSIKRGPLPRIIEKEFENYNISYVGQHRGTKLSIIFEANVFKFFNLLKFCYQNKIDIGVSVGGFVLGAVLKLLRKPNIQFDDDPESKMNHFFERLTASELFLPSTTKSKGKIKNFNALKEWAYLSPNNFSPHDNVLNSYKLKQKEYIFVREVWNKSFNYINQEPNLVSTISKRFPNNFKVLLSLEDKTALHKYPSSWIFLKEPIEDIHSLIYYSKLLISSGDSMAREGALLGVPSIYCGFRNMAANRVLVNKDMLFHLKPELVPGFVEKIIEGKIKVEEQNGFRGNLLNEWVDVTEFVTEKVNNYINK